LGDPVYVRAYDGTESRWYQAALRQKAGRITAVGMMKEVAFEPVSGSISDSIDDAYRSKYETMIGAHAGARNGQDHAACWQGLDHVATATTMEVNHGNQKMRFAAICERAFGLVHWNGAGRSSV
jgi:hypothetical protein